LEAGADAVVFMNDRPDSPSDDEPSMPSMAGRPWGASENEAAAGRIEQRLQALEKSEDRTFGILRWLLILIIAFAGYSWWSMKANRDKKDALEQRVDLLEKKQAGTDEKSSNARDQQFEKKLAASEEKLTDAGDKQFGLLHDRADEAFNALSNRLDAQLASLQAGNEAKLLQLAALFSNNLGRLSGGLQQGLESEASSNLNAALSNAAAGLNADRQALLAEVTNATAKALGTALMTQGQYLLGKTDSRTESIHAAACSYAGAADLFLRAGDAAATRRCLAALCDDCLPALVSRVSPEDFAKLEHTESIRGSLSRLIPELEEAGSDGEYSTALVKLKAASAQLDKRFKNPPVHSRKS
jgi:hypothetical protein